MMAISQTTTDGIVIETAADQTGDRRRSGKKKKREEEEATIQRNDYIRIHIVSMFK